jgi:hypothetical protein
MDRWLYEVPNACDVVSMIKSRSVPDILSVMLSSGLFLSERDVRQIMWVAVKQKNLDNCITCVCSSIVQPYICRIPGLITILLEQMIKKNKDECWKHMVLITELLCANTPVIMLSAATAAFQLYEHFPIVFLRLIEHDNSLGSGRLCMMKYLIAQCATTFRILYRGGITPPSYSATLSVVEYFEARSHKIVHAISILPKTLSRIVSDYTALNSRSEAFELSMGVWKTVAIHKLQSHDYSKFKFY